MQITKQEQLIIANAYRNSHSELLISSIKNKNQKLNSKNEWILFKKTENEKVVTFNKIVNPKTTIMGRICLNEQNEIIEGNINFNSHKNSSKNIKQINGIYHLSFKNNAYELLFIDRNGWLFPLTSGNIKHFISQEELTMLINTLLNTVIKYYGEKRKKPINLSNFNISELLNQEQDALKILEEEATKIPNCELSSFLDINKPKKLVRIKEK